jgi:hypothetical protein
MFCRKGPNLSTNEILFDCQVDLLTSVPTHSARVHDFVSKYFRYRGNEGRAHENFSHDNWTGVYLWAYNFDKKLLKTLPIRGYHSLHPVRALFFSWFHYPKTVGKMLQPLYLDAMLTCKQGTTLNGHGNFEIPTSGKLLYYFKFKYGIRDDSYFHNMTEWVQDSVGGWDRCFEIYYPKDHRVYQAYLAQKK